MEIILCLPFLFNFTSADDTIYQCNSIDICELIYLCYTMYICSMFIIDLHSPSVVLGDSPSRSDPTWIGHEDCSPSAAPPSPGTHCRPRAGGRYPPLCRAGSAGGRSSYYYYYYCYCCCSCSCYCCCWMRSDCCSGCHCNCDSGCDCDCDCACDSR